MKLRVLITSLILSSCATSIVSRNSEPVLSLNQVNIISCAANYSNEVTKDCKEEVLLCLKQENTNLNNKTNKNIRLDIKRKKSESSSAILFLSFVTLGIILTHSRMFTETISFF